MIWQLTNAVREMMFPHVYTYRSVRTEWAYSFIWLLAISLISSETTSKDSNERRRRYNIFIILGCYISHACRPCSCMRVETERGQSL